MLHHAFRHNYAFQDAFHFYLDTVSRPIITHPLSFWKYFLRNFYIPLYTQSMSLWKP
jgi:hypothetical protein